VKNASHAITTTRSLSFLGFVGRQRPCMVVLRSPRPRQCLSSLSIIQLLRFVLLDRSSSAEFFWPILLFSPRLIQARKLFKIPQVIAPRLHFCRGRRRGSCAPHTVTISNSFSSRPRRFHARPPKVERSVRTDRDTRLLLIVAPRTRSESISQA